MHQNLVRINTKVFHQVPSILGHQSRKERVESMVPDWSTERGEGTSRLSLSTPKDILRSREKVTLEKEDGEKQRAWSDMVQKPLNQTRHEPRGKILCR